MEERPSGAAGAAAPAAIQQRVLEFWQSHDVPGRLVHGPVDGPEFRFTEGPPTANGVPHLGHLISRTLKDVHLRYRRMRGFRIVSPLGGWDCHGLPVELEVEKRHGLRSPKEIEEYGVEKFDDECRSSALEVADVWREMSRRLGYWLDYDHAYYTMAAPYVESVWWSLKTLFDRGYLTKGHYVLPYCPRQETPLSSHEVAQGYHETTDPSVTVRLRLSDRDGATPRFLLIWTTTPWTLPANLLVAVRPELEYVVVRSSEGDELVLSAEAARRYFPEGPQVVASLKGTELVGARYEPLFPFAGPGENRYRVVADAMVDATEGTGFVHIAPSFGPDDQRIGAREKVGVFDPLDARGVFTPLVPPVADRPFKAADEVLVGLLRDQGALVRAETIRHTYPFCWRCGSPLLYRAIDSWFVTASKRTASLVENNRSVKWVPEYLRDGRFGNFLTEAKDWALSRNRYWGTPLPIWTCENGHAHCVGSFAELEQLVGTKLPSPFDPHRVTVDRLTFPCPTCRAPARREPYTIDAWYDSGSAPFAQYHYPFEPGPFQPDRALDYVAEGLDQTRGWFYTLLVLSTLLFDRPAYGVCISTGLVLDESGQKMSKSKGNAIEPLTLLERQGGDAVRWSLLTTDYTEAFRVSEAAIQKVGARTLSTWVNVAEFYLQNAAADGLAVRREPPQPTGLLDRWLLSRLESVTARAGSALDTYDPHQAALALKEFVDDLSTWYLRRSRPRFWSEGASEDRRAANDTLSFALLTLGRLMAPLTPFTAEYVHQRLLGGGFDDGARSVHAERWPEPGPLPDAALETGMTELRQWVEVGRALRQVARVKSRIPLPAFALVGSAAEGMRALGPEGEELLKEELNVRRVDRLATFDASEFPDADWVRREDDGEVVALLSARPTPELLRDGLRREVMRRLQLARKEAGLAYTDRIDVTLWAPAEVRAAIEPEREELRTALLADGFEIAAGAAPEEPDIRRWDLDEVSFSARLRRAA